MRRGGVHEEVGVRAGRAAPAGLLTVDDRAAPPREPPVEGSGAPLPVGAGTVDQPRVAQPPEAIVGRAQRERQRCGDLRGGGHAVLIQQDEHPLVGR